MSTPDSRADSVNIHDRAQRRLSAIRLIAKMPTLAAIAYKTAIGQPVVYPVISARDRAGWAVIAFDLCADLARSRHRSTAISALISHDLGDCYDLGDYLL
mgnify:CR=1 FL=1